MPSIHINGLRGGVDAIRAFKEELKRIIEDVNAYHLTTRDIDVYILHEYAPSANPNITVDVHGVSAETTIEGQNALAKTVHDAIRTFLRRKEYLEHYQDVDRVTVRINTFDPEEQGYACSTTRRRKLELVAKKS